MKNVTITLDDETHRKARIKAAERGTSLSALVKQYLTDLAQGDMSGGVREMSMAFTQAPKAQKAFVPLKKPRQPGAMRGQIGMADDFDETPEWLLDAFEGKNTDLPWPE